MLSATPARSLIPTARKGTLGSFGTHLSSEVGRTCWPGSSGRRQRPTRRRARLCHADKSQSHLYRPRNPLGSTAGSVADQQTAAPKCGRKWRRKEKQVARDPEATSCSTKPSNKRRAASIISRRSRFRRLPSRCRRTRSGMTVSKVNLQSSQALHAKLTVIVGQVPLLRLRFPRDKIVLLRKPVRLISTRSRDHHATRPRHIYTPFSRTTLIPRIVTHPVMNRFSDNSRRSRTKCGYSVKL